MLTGFTDSCFPLRCPVGRLKPQNPKKSQCFVALGIKFPKLLVLWQGLNNPGHHWPSQGFRVRFQHMAPGFSPGLQAPSSPLDVHTRTKHRRGPGARGHPGSFGSTFTVWDGVTRSCGPCCNAKGSSSLPGANKGEQTERRFPPSSVLSEGRHQPGWVQVAFSSSGFAI